jgi:hypothetical protein
MCAISRLAYSELPLPGSLKRCRATQSKIVSGSGATLPVRFIRRRCCSRHGADHCTVFTLRPARTGRTYSQNPVSDSESYGSAGADGYGK